MSDPVRRPPRWWRRGVALTGAAVALALLALEGGLRVVGAFEPEPTWYVGELDNRPSENFVVDPATGWRMRPDHHFTRPAEGVEIDYLSDGDGFRRSLSGAGHEDEAGPLIGFVGDSQTWGFGVPFERSFSELLAARLGARSLNCAQPGFGIDQIGLALRHQLLPRAPRLVVVGVFRNDFDRSLQSYRSVEGFNKPTFVLDGGELRRRTYGDRPGAVRVWLERHSHLYTLLAKKLEGAGWLEEDTSWVDLNAALLERMQSDARAAVVPLLFVRIPRALGTRFPPLDAILADIGASYVDPATAPPADADVYLPDRHLNEAGHRWVADAIERWVREHLPELAAE